MDKMIELTNRITDERKGYVREILRTHSPEFCIDFGESICAKHLDCIECNTELIDELYMDYMYHHYGQ